MEKKFKYTKTKDGNVSTLTFPNSNKKVKYLYKDNEIQDIEIEKEKIKPEELSFSTFAITTVTTNAVAMSISEKESIVEDTVKEEIPVLKEMTLLSKEGREVVLTFDQSQVLKRLETEIQETIFLHRSPNYHEFLISVLGREFESSIASISVYQVGDKQIITEEALETEIYSSI